LQIRYQDEVNQQGSREKQPITFNEAWELLDLDRKELSKLILLSHKVTAKYQKNRAFLCSIISAKTGLCPENCTFCAQSVYSSSPINSHPMADPEEILKSAREAESYGAHEFCIVTSGKEPNAKTLKRVIEAVGLIRKYTNLKVGCSLGILREEQAWALKEAGVFRYNHNLETARSFFPNICTTHKYEDRLKTALLVKKVGMELCCGGIFGLGEGSKERIELAFELKELGHSIVPINFLDPRPGTPLSNMPKISPLEAIKIISVFRLILLDKVILCAGGREPILGDFQSLAVFAGANGIIVGNYLTTFGRSPKEDLEMIQRLGMCIS